MSPVRIEAQRRLPVPLHEGFDYITDPANWPAYWPRLVSLDRASRWHDPGDRARVTLRFLGRAVTLDMTLLRIEPYRLVEYRSEQRGLPDAAHRRRFDDVDGALLFAIAVDFEPRRGWRGGIDRSVLRRATARTVRQTHANLDRHFRARRSPHS